MRLKVFVVVLLFCVFWFFAAGCATSKKITADILGKEQTLRKKIAFLSSANASNYGGEDFQRAAAEQLTAFLRAHCHNLRIIDSRSIRRALEDVRRPPSGQIDNLALAKVGRVFGLSAVVTQTIGQPECLMDKRGIWGFRRTCRLVRLSFRVRVYDIQTTAILLDEIVKEDVEVSESDWDNIKKTNGYNEGIAHGLLADATAETGKMICERLAQEPWKGYIITGSDNTFTISAGTDVGLVSGDVLEVFALGEPVKAQDGHIYLVSGPKIGEVRVTQVKGDRAQAVGVLGYDLEQSSFVRLKQ
jgi:hypothetical protein